MCHLLFQALFKNAFVKEMYFFIRTCIFYYELLSKYINIFSYYIFCIVSFLALFIKIHRKKSLSIYAARNVKN